MTYLVKLSDLRERAEYFASLSVSKATKRAYESDWNDFYNFCRSHELESLPATPETVCLYISRLASQNTVSTIVRRLTSITAIHHAAKHDSPAKNDAVNRVMKGIKRKHGTPPYQSKALSWGDTKRLIAQCDCLMIGLRDAAILALGWTSALRRSEIVALDIGDLEFCKEGLVISVRRSKTDQEGQGAKIGIPRSKEEPCPVEIIKRWIDRLADYGREPHNPLFVRLGAAARGKWFAEPGDRLDDRIVNNIVKRYAKYAGFNPQIYSAHSLRRGLATEAGARGVPERVISRHTRHRSIAVLRGYIESGTIWAENPLPAIYETRTIARLD